MILSLPDGRVVKRECVGGRVWPELAPAELCKAWEWGEPLTSLDDQLQLLLFGSSSVDTLHRSRNSLLCSGKSFSGWSLLRLTVLRKKKTCSLAFLFIYVGGILIIKIKIINSPAQVLWDIQSDRRNVCDLLYFFPIDAQCSVVMCLTWISIFPCAFEPASPSLVSCYFELEQVKPLFLLYDTICVLIWNFCWLWSFPNKHWNCPKYLLSTLQWGSALPG